MVMITRRRAAGRSRSIPTAAASASYSFAPDVPSCRSVMVFSIASRSEVNGSSFIHFVVVADHRGVAAVPEYRLP